MFSGIFGRQNWAASKFRSFSVTDEEREQVEAECKACGAAAGYWCLTAAGMPASEVCPGRAEAVSG